jgi:hypothetical protein
MADNDQPARRDKLALTFRKDPTAFMAAWAIAAVHFNALTEEELRGFELELLLAETSLDRFKASREMFLLATERMVLAVDADARFLGGGDDAGNG